MSEVKVGQFWKRTQAAMYEDGSVQIPAGTMVVVTGVEDGEVSFSSAHEGGHGCSNYSDEVEVFLEENELVPDGLSVIQSEMQNLMAEAEGLKGHAASVRARLRPVKS